MPRPGEQYLIRLRLSRPRCQLLYRVLNPTRELLKSLFYLVMPSLIPYFISASRAFLRRVGEATAASADEVGYRRLGVPQCF
jgi:hypothetical protein